MGSGLDSVSLGRKLQISLLLSWKSLEGQAGIKALSTRLAGRTPGAGFLCLEVEVGAAGKCVEAQDASRSASASLGCAPLRSPSYPGCQQCRSWPLDLKPNRPSSVPLDALLCREGNKMKAGKLGTPDVAFWR